MTETSPYLGLFLIFTCVGGCSSDSAPDARLAQPAVDAAVPDERPPDARPLDARPPDAAVPDASGFVDAPLGAVACAFATNPACNEKHPEYSCSETDFGDGWVREDVNNLDCPAGVVTAPCGGTATQPFISSVIRLCRPGGAGQVAPCPGGQRPTTGGAGCGVCESTQLTCNEESVAVENDGWRITATKPVLSGSMLQGGMVFARTSGADTRGGGVCLVADLGNGKACSTAADCESITLPEGGFHYCVGVNGASAKTCWTRPSAEGCDRNPVRTPGQIKTPLVPARVNDQPTRWISLACLALASDAMGCATGASVYATSPVTSVP